MGEEEGIKCKFRFDSKLSSICINQKRSMRMDVLHDF